MEAHYFHASRIHDRRIPHLRQSQLTLAPPASPSGAGGRARPAPAEEAGFELPAAKQVVVHYARQGIETFISARKRWLDFAAQQNTQFLTAVKGALSPEKSETATEVTDWAQGAVDSYVALQKRWLDRIPLPGQAG